MIVGATPPIVEELHTLKASGMDGVVAIDDMWCFNGTNGYPTIDALHVLIEQLWPGAVATHDDEVLWFVTPRV